MTKILRINMTNQTATSEEIPESLRGLGGRGLTSGIVEREVPPRCDPLGPENKLVFAAGVLAGTAVPNTGRLSVGAKSPLTKGIKEANSGGSAAHKLAGLGFQAVVFEGQAKEWTAVRIDAKGVRFASASTLTGLGNYALMERMKHEHGTGVSVISIGQAGEMKLTASGIAVSSPDFHIRMAARGGLGAVMGSKRLKAIVIESDGRDRVEPKDKKRLKEAIALMSKGMLENPFSQGLKTLGTPQIVGVTNGVGALPTKNYSTGKFEKAEQISGEHMAELMKTRPNSQATHRCMDGCIIGCSNVCTDQNGELIVSGIEYETLALVGSNCMIGDFDTVARINRVCNDVGVDTMDVGGAIAVAMENGLLKWGDGEAALELVKEIGARTERGRMIGNGCHFTGEKMAAKRVPTVKGQCLSGYDPRILKGTGVTFATSPQGADHTTGIVLPGPHFPDYNPMACTGQGPRSQLMQNYMAAIDTLGMCMMAGLALVETPGLHVHLVNALSALYGRDLDDNYPWVLGESVLRTERRFNDAAGFTANDDRLPRFFSEEPIMQGGPVFDVPAEEMDRVNRF